MDLLVADIVERFYNLLWPMVRISAFLIAAPFFSLRSVSLRIRILLALALTWMIYPLTDWPTVDPISAEGLREVFVQAFIGVLMGLILQVISAALVVGGQAISASMGLSMANMVDPNMGNVPVISQFLIICSTLLFLGLGGHVLVITMLIAADLPLLLLCTRRCLISAFPRRRDDQARLHGAASLTGPDMGAMGHVHRWRAAMCTEGAPRCMTCVIRSLVSR